MPLLIEFSLRLAFGLALAMALTPATRVTSGYYRNHLYVLLGLNVLATLAAISDRERFALWPPLAGAVLSYVGSVVWLYEKPRGGLLMLLAVAAVDLAGTQLNAIPSSGWSLHAGWCLADAVSAGLLLGSTIAAMFLGHWYLNTPTMELAPLRRLIGLMGVSLLGRAIVAAAGLIAARGAGEASAISLPLLSLRWLAGLVAMAPIVWMTWQTLKIPNTQSATGILYVGVILTFLGELVALLLSDSTSFPV